MKKLLTTKRLAAVVLALALCLGGVHAAGEELFPAVNAYPGYADVKETARASSRRKRSLWPSAPPWPPASGRSSPGRPSPA